MESAFNGFSVSHKDDRDRFVSKSIPIIYGLREKSMVIDDYSDAQIKTGNTKVIPCGYLSLEAMSKSDDRSTNKNRTTIVDGTTYMYNSVPYDFIFSIEFRCRGATEAYQIVEQVAPIFNPVLNLDVWDSLYKDKPTRVAITLDGIDVEPPAYDDTSNNIYTVNISCTLRGWIYQPLLKGAPIYNKILNVSLDPDNNAYMSLVNDNVIKPVGLKLNIIDIIKKSNILTAIVDCDPSLVIDYEWVSDASINPNGKECKVNTKDSFTIELTLKDQFGNFTSMTKKFNKSIYV